MRGFLTGHPGVTWLRAVFRTILPLVMALAAFAAACDDDATGAAGTDAPADAQAADDVEALAERLDGVDAGCTLEYEGLEDDQRELSICTLGDEIVELSVWSDPEALDGVVEAAEGTGDPVVTGPNWSIDVQDAELADRIADATGGTVRS